MANPTPAPDPTTKQHKSFRFNGTTSQQLKDIATLFGKSETAMLEEIIDNYYAHRIERFEEDRAARIQKAL